MKFLEKLGFKTGDDHTDVKVQSVDDIGNENYILIYPKSVEEEVNRTVNSMGIIDKEIPRDKTYEMLVDDLKDTENQLNDIDKDLDQIIKDKENQLEDVPYTIDYLKKSSKLKENMLEGDKYFFFSGWVADSKLDEVKKLSDKYKDTLISEKKNNEVGLVPPTKLKNNILFQHF